MKILFRAACFLGCIVYGVVLYIASRFGNWGDGSGYNAPLSFPRLLLEDFWLACPFIYFVVAFCTSFAKRRSLALLSAGVIGHLFLVGFLLPLFLHGSTGVVFLLPSLFCTFLWGLMYQSLARQS